MFESKEWILLRKLFPMERSLYHFYVLKKQSDWTDWIYYKIFNVLLIKTYSFIDKGEL